MTRDYTRLAILLPLAEPEMPYTGFGRVEEYVSPEEKTKIRIAREQARKRKKGLHLFQFGKHVVWALNYKNAERKARKKGYINTEKCKQK